MRTGVWSHVLAWAALAGLAWQAYERPDGEWPLLLATAALGALLLPSRALARRIGLWLPGPRLRTFLACSFVLLTSFAIFGPAVVAGEAGRRGDWPFNLALAHELYDALSRGRGTPQWVLGISAGDPTFELYPSFVHQVVARISLLLGSPSHIHAVACWTAFFAYTSVAVSVTRLALRFASLPAAVLVGVACLVDMGTTFTWGVHASWSWGLFPSTVSIGLVLWMMPTLLDLVGGRATRSAPPTIWALCAVAAFAHPIAVVFLAVLLLSCAAAALFSIRTMRARWASAALHVAIGTALAGFQWIPEARRLLEHGVHYGTPQIPLRLAFERAVAGELPDTSFRGLIVLSWASALFALAARDRKQATFPFIVAWGMLALYLEPLFLQLGLAPTPTTVRMQSFRVSTVAVPLLYATVAYGLSLASRVSQAPGTRWSRGLLRVAGASALVVVAITSLESASAWARAHMGALEEAVRTPQITDRAGYDAMVGFFREQARSIEPGHYGRAVYFHTPGSPNEILLLHARAGVPVLARSDRPPMFFLRDQFFDDSPENLRRFAIRWAIDADHPPPIGDPATERRFGTFFVREVRESDGQLAHAVEGEGTLAVESIADDEIAVRLDGTDRPALVELGTPYYGRWRAYHDGVEIPTCARPVTPVLTSQRVLAAWVPPGRTELRPDGSLPSDGAGLPWTLLAGALALGASPWRPVRERWRRLVQWLWRRARMILSPWTAALVFLLIAIVLPARQGAFGGIARSFRFGGLFGSAQVHWIDGEERRRCDADWSGHRFTCPDGTSVEMSMVECIRNMPVGWAAPTPGLYIQAPNAFEIDVRTDARFGRGTHHAACTGRCDARMALGGVDEIRFGHGQTLTFDLPRETRGVRLHVRGGPGQTWLALARADAIEVPEGVRVPFCPARPER